MFDTIRKIIESRFQAQWPGLSSSVAHTFEALPEPENKTEWVRLSVRLASGERTNIGKPVNERQTGLVYLQIFAERNKGTKRTNEMADWFGSIFRDAQVVDSGVEVSFFTPEKGGTVERDEYLQTLVTVRFEADKVF